MKLSPCVRKFFDQYLPHIKGVSHDTVIAYRDAFKREHYLILKNYLQPIEVCGFHFDYCGA